jgi:hypothetical protein
MNPKTFLLLAVLVASLLVPEVASVSVPASEPLVSTANSITLSQTDAFNPSGIHLFFGNLSWHFSPSGNISFVHNHDNFSFTRPITTGFSTDNLIWYNSSTIEYRTTFLTFHVNVDFKRFDNTYRTKIILSGQVPVAGSISLGTDPKAVLKSSFAIKVGSLAFDWSDSTSFSPTWNSITNTISWLVTTSPFVIDPIAIVTTGTNCTPGAPAASLTATIDVTSGNELAVVVADVDPPSAISTPTDTVGTSLVQRVLTSNVFASGPSSASIRIFSGYAAATNAADVITVSAISVSTNICIIAMQFSGVNSRTGTTATNHNILSTNTHPEVQLGLAAGNNWLIGGCVDPNTTGDLFVPDAGNLGTVEDQNSDIFRLSAAGGDNTNVSPTTVRLRTTTQTASWWACVAYEASPSFDYNVAWNPTSATVAPGSSTTPNVVVTLVHGPASVVNCTITFPAITGLSASPTTFSTTPTFAGATQAVTISTTTATSGGTYTISVSCVAPTHSAFPQFSLTVTGQGSYGFVI